LLKSGLTANLKIETARKDNVNTIPLYLIEQKDGKNFVKLINKENKDTKLTEVVLGLSGDNGLVEIISGVGEGDSIEY
jgi:multidrug efflux pump subunit AcrA (membrane-fusion protein)